MARPIVGFTKDKSLLLNILIALLSLVNIQQILCLVAVIHDNAGEGSVRLQLTIASISAHVVLDTKNNGIMARCFVAPLCAVHALSPFYRRFEHM